MNETYIIYFLRRLTMYLLDGLFFLRVFLPKVFFPQGLSGEGWPIPAFCSPPPWGWSQGFIAEPRTVGRIPRQRLRPAFPNLTKLASLLLTLPIVARQVAKTFRTSLDINFTNT